MIKLDFTKGEGLIPVIAQDAETKEVLKTGKATYWSRSRQTLWLKGETSGHVQLVKDIFVDCDNDTILLHVKQLGEAACHTGYRSCFYRKVKDGDCVVVGEKIFDPKDVYK